ncbi:MAG: hypothetical protein KDD78_17110, partial [Caldilineaceae bacterium]|nr:hypothetical protein [Caldilineaceae bacterium]
HGSAPDIAGRGIANPIATVLAGAMLLDHLGENAAARRIEQAVTRTLANGPKTGDLGGDASTAQITDALIAALTPVPSSD